MHLSSAEIFQNMAKNQNLNPTNLTDELSLLEERESEDRRIPLRARQLRGDGDAAGRQFNRKKLC